MNWLNTMQLSMNFNSIFHLLYIYWNTGRKKKEYKNNKTVDKYKLVNSTISLEFRWMEQKWKKLD